MRSNLETLVAIPPGIVAIAIAQFAGAGVVESVAAGALAAIAARLALRLWANVQTGREVGDDAGG